MKVDRKTKVFWSVAWIIVFSLWSFALLIEMVRHGVVGGIEITAASFGLGICLAVIAILAIDLVSTRK